MLNSASLDTIAETTGPRRRDVIEETRQIFESFMSLSEAPEGRGEYARDPSLDLSLDFSTDIEADSISASAELGQRESMQERSETTGSSTANGDADSERYREVGLALQRIGDDIDANYLKKHADVEKTLQNLGEQLVTEAAETAFQETIENILTEFNGSFPNPEEKYQVALVMLCTRRSVTVMNSALSSTKRVRDVVIGSAMKYIAGHYPRWIDNLSV